MNVGRHIKLVIVVLACLAGLSAEARRLNDKLMYRQEADRRPWHLGFGVGMHFQELMLKNNGFETPGGEQWVVQNNSYSPGFNLCGLVDARLSGSFNLRFAPGLMFGSRDLAMRDLNNGTTMSQNLKSVYLSIPVELKYSAMRYRNVRPYLLGGLMPAADVSRSRGEMIALKKFDLLACVGFGCDIYLPYFKFNPELKFCFGLTDALRHDRPDLGGDDDLLKITQSVSRAVTSMIVLTFYFE